MFYFVGGSFPFTIGRIEHGYKVRPDLCATDCDKSPRSFLGKIWTDSLVHDVNAIKLLTDVIGQASDKEKQVFIFLSPRSL